MVVGHIGIQILELSIQPRGVRAKFAGTQMVAYSKRAGAEEKLLTSNIQTFMHDIARFFWETSGTDKPYEEASSLKRVLMKKLSSFESKDKLLL